MNRSSWSVEMMQLPITQVRGGSIFLRVPPFIKTAKEAVAWTFGFLEADYNPLIES